MEASLACGEGHGSFSQRHLREEGRWMTRGDVESELRARGILDQRPGVDEQREVWTAAQVVRRVDPPVVAAQRGVGSIRGAGSG